MQIKRTHTGAELLGLTVTYDSKEIRNEIEKLLETNESLELHPKYSYEIIRSRFHGQVAKIIINPVRSEYTPDIKYEYTKEEIEEEVERRVRFKMNELLTGLKNRSKYNWQNAFNSGNPKYSHFMEAQDEMVEMFNKELEMKFPYEVNEMKKKENGLKLDKVRDNIIEKFKLRGRYSSQELYHVLYHLLEPLLK